MKLLTLAGLALAAVALSGCVSAGLITGATAPGGGADSLPVLKEVNRHIELCERTYGWPFTAVIHCAPQGPASLTAEQVAAIVNAAVAKALEAYTAPADQ